MTTATMAVKDSNETTTITTVKTVLLSPNIFFLPGFSIQGKYMNI